MAEKPPDRVRTDIWKADKEEMADALDVLQEQRKRELKKSIRSTVGSIPSNRNSLIHSCKKTR